MVDKNSAATAAELSGIAAACVGLALRKSNLSSNSTRTTEGIRAVTLCAVLDTKVCVTSTPLGAVFDCQDGAGGRCHGRERAIGDCIRVTA